jgi:hypothetical protein
MPLIRVVILLGILFAAFSVSAQEQPSETDLTADSIDIVSGVSDFGQPAVEANGHLINNGRSAYTNITLDVVAYDADEILVGEGIGVLVNACGDGLLPNFTLQPGASQTFNAPLELIDLGVSVARLDVIATGEEVEPTPTEPLAEGITAVTEAETVNVEWINDHSFRYAAGCQHDISTNWTWYTYNADQDASTQIVAPHADDVNDEMRRRLELQDDAEFAHSMMRFTPDGERVVYQNARNDFLTAYLNGTFRRGLYIGLNNRHLQGVYWQPQERFIAYYYGAFGDPVYYFTADAEARVISPALENNPPSLTVPGVSRDGRRVVVSGDYQDGRGYYLYVVTNGFFELIFTADPPGNNYPAPIPLEVAAPADPINRIYVALPVDGAPHLQCFNRDEGAVHDLVALPLNLSDSDRAQWWISPDNALLALTADGENGGLWLIDLAALPDCGTFAPATPAS